MKESTVGEREYYSFPISFYYIPNNPAIVPAIIATLTKLDSRIGYKNVFYSF